MRIILAGGGTGGHITPNLAIYQELKAQLGNDLEVLYIGSKNGIDEKIVAPSGLKFEAISCGKLRRYFSWENFSDFFKTIFGVFQSIGKIGRFKPEVIFCKGGFVCLPVVIAGWIMRKPVILHESDVIPGLANKISAGLVEKICVSFEESKKYFKQKDKIVLTDNPVRAEIAQGSREAGFTFTGLAGKKPIILVIGGSQGASFINELIWEKLEELLNEFEIIHICGPGKENPQFKNKYSGYFSLEYAAEEQKDLLAISDLLISRAGANSLAEIAFLGKPAVIIPLVKGSRGDQVVNAEVFAKENSALVIDEENFLDSQRASFVNDIKKYYNEHKVNKHNIVNGAAKAAEVILSFRRK